MECVPPYGNALPYIAIYGFLSTIIFRGLRFFLATLLKISFRPGKLRIAPHRLKCGKYAIILALTAPAEDPQNEVCDGLLAGVIFSRFTTRAAPSTMSNRRTASLRARPSPSWLASVSNESAMITGGTYAGSVARMNLEDLTTQPTLADVAA